MTRSTAIVAGKIISKADRAHPADVVLRDQLRQARADPAEARHVSRAVFAYYRWRGWVAGDKPIVERVSETTELARSFEKDPGSFQDEDLLAKALPGWLKSEAELGPGWVRSLQRPPKIWLRARPGQAHALAKELGSARVFEGAGLGDIVQYLGAEDLFRSAQFHAGKFELQDISSQAVGLICQPQPGETWWDACAGQGGKTLHFGDLMQNKGLVWASDRAVWRLAVLKRRAARAGLFNYRAREWSGGQRLPTKTVFDGVLVDAPCSGVGTWQRHPHARWTVTPQDVAELSEAQKRLLVNAARAVRPGGKLVYAVCTITRRETSEVVKEFEARCGDFRPLPWASPLEKESRPQHGWLLAGEEIGGNSMFVAAWVRS